MFVGSRTIRLGLATVTLVTPEGLEQAHGNEATGVGQSGIARLVPLWIVFTADDMEEIPARETQLLRGLRRVVVKRPDNLFRIRSQ
jgi:hypothetical protein